MTRPFREGDYVSFMSPFTKKIEEAYVIDPQRRDCGLISEEHGRSFWYDYSWLTLVRPATDESINFVRDLFHKQTREEGEV